MKFIKILSLLGIMANLMFSNIAYAAEDIIFSVDTDRDTSIVSGSISIPSAAEADEVSVWVTDSSGNFSYMDVLYLNEDRFAEFSYKCVGQTGDYTAKVFVPTMNITDDESFYFISTTTISNAEMDFANVISGVMSADGYLATYARPLGIDSQVVTDMSGNAAFSSSISGTVGSGHNIDEIMLVMNQAAAIVYSDMPDGATKLKTFLDTTGAEVLLDYAQKDGTPIWDVLSENQKKAICAKVAGDSLATPEELSQKLCLYTLTAGISSAKAYTEVQPLMLAYKEAGLLTLTTGNYDVNKYAYMVGKSYASYAEVSSAFNNYTVVTPSVVGGGGGSSSGSGISSFGTGSAVSSTPTVTPVTFNDISLVEWAKKDILKVAEKGIMSGMGNDTFAPAESLTRAQAATMITKLLNIPNDVKGADFTDVNEKDWFYSYVSAVNNKGLMVGVSGTEFAPNKHMTRQEVSLVLYKILTSLGKEKPEFTTDFADDAEIADWAREAVYSLKAFGVINGKTEKEFCPNEPLLRVEAAVMFSKMLDIMG